MSAGALPSRREELVNALTHGSGLLASLLGVPVLVLAALGHGDRRQLVGCVVFAATLVLLYGISTAYHACPPCRAKRVLQRLDHMAIYLLIAGTYTPFTLGVLRDGFGWALFGTVWALAGIGILFKSTLGLRFPRLSTAFYLGMGWLAVVALPPLLDALSIAGLLWVVAGGLCYTVGVLFYHHDHRRFWHAVWHLWVLAGSACHYVAVLRYATVAPA